MAQEGQGDERWIVNERTDGRNVNSWHWEEKQRLPWAKERLSALLLVASGGGGGGGEGGGEAAAAAAAAARVTAVREVSGEATTTTRKGGRRFAVYDLKVTAAWSVGEEGGEQAGEGESGSGSGSGSDGSGSGSDGGGGADGDEKAKKKKGGGGSKARTGTVVIEELASTHDPDDYVLTFKADGAGAEDAAARAEAQRLLTAPLLAALCRFCEEIAAL